MSRDVSASPSPRKAFADRRRDPATKREAVLKTAAQLFLLAYLFAVLVHIADSAGHLRLEENR